ncbi:N-carbamoyl-D-amino-acid hydrolase [Limobrevibacterium gyesilva]|uniref:N-carbamoyl-D-amino-acid hydrolase n=1 Tax=Limobrevibacterium gyesilva TaxID=2991712 RepID=A0AA41YWS6_9PROT|nr:N-carbamoyl-D-amino-acid hydrolase [Limobrevibacterium gyesilva]MCW3476787.1 N-carbamoyl-D-amino-acid hydrolase [Limobrevibacterium gyesilva]
MARILNVGIAQLGPISRNESRQDVVVRLVALMEDAARMGCDLVVYPEAALTAFFPHWWIDDEDELDSWFERAMPNPAVQPLFDAARRLKVGFHLGYAELAFEDGRKRRFNTAILVGKDGEIIGKYRKIHLPGYTDRRPGDPFQNLEKRYFEVGNLGFPVWHAFGGRVGMMICNDRRWPESYRVMGLQGAELILLGYNTPVHNPAMPETDDLGNFHNQLVMQSGAYQNGTWVVGVARAGVEEGVDQIGQSCVIAPSGEVVVQCTTLGDELQVARCDLDLCNSYKTSIFNFAKHRRPEHYGLIVERTGAGDVLGR